MTAAPTSDRPSLPVVRHSARVLLLDETDRLLLFTGCDPDRPERTFWCTPGGGMEPGETAAECARRELHEETGLGEVDLGRLVWTRRAQFRFLGVDYDQREVFFLARCAAFDVDTSGFSATEVRAHETHRWWTREELLASDDDFAPADLPVRLAELLDGGAPLRPVEVAGATHP